LHPSFSSFNPIFFPIPSFYFVYISFCIIYTFVLYIYFSSSHLSSILSSSRIHPYVLYKLIPLYVFPSILIPLYLFSSIPSSYRIHRSSLYILPYYI
jgi:hypothetical protein